VAEAALLERLERWYQSQCDGDWEHAEGVEIGTLDNPGWRVKVSLTDTNLESRPFERIAVERSDDDWLHAWVDDNVWHAAAGPFNLTEALDTFLSWAES
jgi:hypothetical protein